MQTDGDIKPALRGPFLDSGFRRKDTGGTADNQWQIAAGVLSMRPGLQYLAISGMTHVRFPDASGRLSILSEMGAWRRA